MNFFGINESELLIIILLAVVILGPERLPEYAAKLARGVRSLRAYAEGARTQLQEELGPDFKEVDWAAYDPRQYDPRRIVREALSDVDLDPRSLLNPAAPTSGKPVVHDPSAPTPWDDEAT